MGETELEFDWELGRMVVSWELFMTNRASSTTVVNQMFDTVTAKLMATWNSGLLDEVTLADSTDDFGFRSFGKLDFLGHGLGLLSLGVFHDFFSDDLGQHGVTSHGRLERLGTVITERMAMFDFSIYNWDLFVALDTFTSISE